MSDHENAEEQMPAPLIINFVTNKEDFLSGLQKQFDKLLSQVEELSPGVYTPKTDPIFAAYQNYGLL